MKTSYEKRPFFSLRFRLVLLVAIELVGSVLLAVWLSEILDRYLPADLEIPLLLYLVVVSLFVGVLVTIFLSLLLPNVMLIPIISASI